MKLVFLHLSWKKEPLGYDKFFLIWKSDKCQEILYELEWEYSRPRRVNLMEKCRFNDIEVPCTFLVWIGRYGYK